MPFNSCFKKELLTAEVFSSLGKASKQIEQWGTYATPNVVTILRAIARRAGNHNTS